MMATTFKNYELPKSQSVAHFDIFAAFEKLDTNRKLALVDQLFHAGTYAYLNMVQKFWPDANEMDSAKLERLLRARIERTLQTQ